MYEKERERDEDEMREEEAVALVFVEPCLDNHHEEKKKNLPKKHKTK